MKRKYLFFKYVLGALALVTAFGLNSFTNVMEKKESETAQSTVWFPASSLGQTNPSRANFNLENGTTVQPQDCEQTHEFNCAMGYSITDCEPTGTPNVYRLKDDVTTEGTVIRYEE